jgi:WD40 repeat protein
MVQRQLVVERFVRGKKIPVRIQMSVDDQEAIGPWVMMLTTRLGCPLVDNFGSPIMYRLRSTSGEYILPKAGRFADARFPSGSHFVLEPDMHGTVPLRENARKSHLPPSLSVASFRFSRRSLMNVGILTTFSLFGLGSGMTTAFAQRLLNQRKVATMPVSVQTTFSRHQQTVRAVSWAPDESMVASGGDDGMAFVWKVDGTVLRLFQFNAPVHAIAWSPDGVQLATGAANTVSFFDAHTGSLLAENAGQHSALVTSLGWTNVPGVAPLALSAGIDKRAIVWSEQSHQPQVVFRLHTAPIEALAVLATTVVTASEGGLARVWSALSGQEIHGYYSDTKQPLRSAAFSSKGSLAMGSDDGMIHMWSDGRTCMRQVPDVFGRHCVDGAMLLQGHIGSVRAMAFAPDGMRLATGGDDKKLIIWSMSTMKPLLIMPQQDMLTALSWSPSGQFLAGAFGSRVAIWQIHL